MRLFIGVFSPGPWGPGLRPEPRAGSEGPGL